MDLVFDIGLLIMLAGVGAFLAKIMRQPMIPAYVLSGVIIGNVLGLNADPEMVKSVSELGIAFLLFIVGLELDLKKVKHMGMMATVTGSIQIAVTFALGYAGARLLNFDHTQSIYLGVIIALSSTMIVVKILSDKREINTLHGRLVIGILLIQDIFAVCALSYLTTMSSATEGATLAIIFKVMILLAVGMLLSKYIFPHIFEFAAKSQELLLAVALSVCFTFGLLANLAGISIAIGAFFAGVLLANLPYNLEIVGKVTTLRDFFSILFFTALGLQLNISNISEVIVPTIVFTLMVIVLKPLIIFILFTAMKYTTRTSFLAASNLAQVSEFSLILVAMGMNRGVIEPGLLTITILLAIITMSSTSYFMIFEEGLYRQFTRILGWLGVAIRSNKQLEDKKLHCDVLLAGYDRIGYSVLESLNKKKKNVLVVDFNPDIIKRLHNLNVPCIYGDVCDPEIMKRLDMNKVKLAISTANRYEDNLLFLKRVKGANNYTSAIVTAHKIDEALELYENGADYVILPHFLGGEMVSTILPDFESNQVKMAMHKYKHIESLIKRKDLGHEHPTRI